MPGFVARGDPCNPRGTLAFMPTFTVKTSARSYPCVVERGALDQLSKYIPERTGKIFVVTEPKVFKLHGKTLHAALNGHPHEVVFFPGGEERKKLAEVESLAEQMVVRGADRSSLIIAFGGGIVGDLGGFLAAIFMRGIPVIQVPTTLQAQVDAAVGGKTGANLVAGKNLIGAFYQPLAVLIEPAFLETLSQREYVAGLHEVTKYGVIASVALFDRMAHDSKKVLARDPATVDEIIAESVRIKAEVVSADEKESGLRRILNFGHTIGHALEAETKYERFLHGEAVAFGMRAAVHLSSLHGCITEGHAERILQCIDLYGEIPDVSNVEALHLVQRTGADKKTIQGRVHFVLVERIGATTIESGLNEKMVLAAVDAAMADLVHV
jgi:3-dehydroquinate synthase